MTDHKAEWVLVPREATRAMLEAAQNREDDEPLSDWGMFVPAAHADIYAAMIAAAPAASEGEDGAVAWRVLIAGEWEFYTNRASAASARAEYETHGPQDGLTIKQEPLYTRPAAQVAATPKHDEGLHSLLAEGYESAAELVDEMESQADAPFDGGCCNSAFPFQANRRLLTDGAKMIRALATQPAARRVTDAQAQRFAEIARDGTVSDFQQEFAAIRSWFAAQPAEGVSGG